MRVSVKKQRSWDAAQTERLLRVDFINNDDSVEDVDGEREDDGAIS